MDQFSQYPLYFMNFYGSTPLDLLFETLDYAIYAYDIQLICIDNMQFMLSQQAQGVAKFDLQDKVATMLRNLATDKNVHVCVIIHPKKVEDETNLTVGSIFGTAKISQEADSVFILQRNNMANYRALQLKKNRFDGEVGEVSMLFNPDNKRYVEITAQEKQMMLMQGGDYKKVFKQREKLYGMVEPTQLKEEGEVAMKIVEGDKKLKKREDMAKIDLEFYRKVKQHVGVGSDAASTGEISLKNVHMSGESTSSNEEEQDKEGYENDYSALD